MTLWQLMTAVLLVVKSDPVLADDQNGEVIKPTQSPEISVGWVKEKTYTFVERQQTCRKYEGKYISYYSQIFLVEACKRREVIDQKHVFQIGSQGTAIHQVAGDVIAQLEVGPPKATYVQQRTCQELEGKFVTVNFVDMYLVESCKKRLFPDWATLESFQRRRGAFGEPIDVLTHREFVKLKSGADIASSLDEEFATLLQGDMKVDILPQQEACVGLEGKIVSFYSRLYKVEACRKREYDPQWLMREKKGQLTYRKLTDQQWLSLPDGKPMPKN